MWTVLITRFAFWLPLTRIFTLYVYVCTELYIGCGLSGVEYERSDRDVLSLRGDVIFS